MSKDIWENIERLNEQKLLESKINDKYKFAISRNKITYTDFLNLSEKNIAEKYLMEHHIKNYQFFGGNGEDSDRNILIFYPEKFSEEMIQKSIDNIISGIRINLPKELKYEHRIYLSGIIKLGIKREKVGDILVRENGADLIVLNEISEFLINNLKQLTRFKSTNIEKIKINDIKIQEKEFEEFNIIVSSMRLDNFVAELAHTSRAKAEEILNEQRVFVNYSLEIKESKKIQIGDVINIRGKGKYIVGDILKSTKSNKIKLMIKKYI